MCLLSLFLHINNHSLLKSYSGLDFLGILHLCLTDHLLSLSLSQLYILVILSFHPGSRCIHIDEVKFFNVSCLFVFRNSHRMGFQRKHGNLCDRLLLSIVGLSCDGLLIYKLLFRNDFQLTHITNQYSPIQYD